MKLKNILIVVKDIEKSRKFYHDLFGIELVHDNDGNMILTEGLVLQDEKIWRSFLDRDIIPKSNSCELYFEEQDIEAFVEKLEKLSYDEILNDLESIITASLKIKQYVVEQDEKEAGLRKILNFGHTFGHAIEAQTEMQGMFHGECVALGMLPMSSVSVRERLIPVLKKINLPVSCQIDIDEALNFVCHDKKCANGFVNAIFVDKIGEFEIKKLSISDFCGLIKGYFAN